MPRGSRTCFRPPRLVWALAGSVTQPLFKGGELMHQRRAAVAAAQEAAANYKATVLTAFQNVSDALLALEGDADALAARPPPNAPRPGSLDLVQAQYKAGGASYLQVLTAEQTYQNAAVALVKARAQRFTDTAALFQALGGGWWNRTDIAANSTAPRLEDLREHSTEPATPRRQARQVQVDDHAAHDHGAASSPS